MPGGDIIAELPQVNPKIVDIKADLRITSLDLNPEREGYDPEILSQPR